MPYFHSHRWQILAGAILSINTMSPSFAAITHSTPVPEPLLNAQTTLESATHTLGQRFEENAAGFERAAEEIERCPAEVDPQTPSHNANARYFECRQQALEMVKSHYRQGAADLREFAAHIQPVQKQFVQAVTANREKIETVQRDIRKAKITRTKLEKRAKQVAESLPGNNAAPSRRQVIEMRKLRAELHFVQTTEQLQQSALSRLKSNDSELKQLGSDLERWGDDADAVAYEFDLNGDLIGQLQRTGALVGEAQILISQLSDSSLERISGVIGQMLRYDFERLSGGTQILPENPPTKAMSTSLLGGSTHDLVEFFNQYKSGDHE